MVGWLLLAAIFVLVLLALFPGMLRSSREERLTRQADSLKKRMGQVFVGAHEYRDVKLEEYPRLDRGWYEAVSRELASAGFTHVGDVVDLTVARALPNLESVSRGFVAADGRVRASAAQVRPKGFARLMQIMGVVPRRLRVVELCGELSDGAMLVTVDSAGIDHLSLPEQIATERLPPETPPLELLRRHLERVAALGDDVPLVLFRDCHDALQSAQRANVLMAIHRDGVGALTREELESSVGRSLTKAEERLIEKLQKPS